MSRIAFFTLVAAVAAACARDPEPARAPVSAGDSVAAMPAAPAPAATPVSSPAAVDTPGALPNSAVPVTPEPPPAASASAGGRAAVPAPTPPQPPRPAPDTASPAAEQDEGAAALRRAAAAYESVRTLRADFVMHFENPLLRDQRTSRGTLYRQRPDRIALIFSDPEGDVIVSDGEYFYAYYPSNNPGQATRTPAGGGGSGVDLQAQFVGNPVERFDYTLHGTENVGGRAARVLTLVPKERAEYRSLKVWLDTRDSLARRFEIVELNGTVRRFELSGMQINQALPESVFRFTPPPGVRVITAG